MFQAMAFSCRSLRWACSLTWHKHSTAKLPRKPWSLRVINQQLWGCCLDAGIMVFDNMLQKLRTIPPDDMDKVYDVAGMNGDNFVIASSNGLHALKFYDKGSTRAF